MAIRPKRTADPRIAGLILVDRLRSVSALQDCLMTRATNCAEIDPPTP